MNAPFAAAVVLSFALGAVGLVHVLGPRFVRRASVRWSVSMRLLRTIGVLQILAACLLAVPHARLWGIVLAGALNFAAVVVLLKNREYVIAVPGVVAQLALMVTTAAAASASV